MALSLDELKILLILHGNKQLDDDIENEIFKNEEFIVLYVNHLYRSLWTVGYESYSIGFKIYLVAKWLIEGRWINAEDYFKKTGESIYIRYKNEHKL